MDYFRNISYMISHIFLMLFIYLFVTHRYSKRKTIGICFSSFLFLTLSDCLKLNFFAESNMCYPVVTVVQILVTQFTVMYISETRDNRVLFMGLTASNYVIAGSIVSAIFFIFTENMFFALAGGAAVHLAILLFLYAKIREIWLKCYKSEYRKEWWELCLIPVFFYCGFSFLAFFPYTIYDHPENSFGLGMFIITMFVSYVVVFRYVESETNRARIYWKNALFKTYIKGLENQYDLVEQSEKNLKILRHDMRHYSNMIDSLLTQGEYGEIRKITEYINGVTDENKVIRYCDNIIVHSILSQMMEKASALEVTVQTDLIVPKELPVSDYELAAVIANLLENAIIGVKDLEDEQKRYVDIKLHCTPEYLLIHTKNVCEKEVVLDSLTGLPKSIKGEDHGLGMQSVYSFSEKIGGNIGCICENGIFQMIFYVKFQAVLRKTGK